MQPYIKITNKFTKKFGSKVIKRQYFHRKTGLKFEIFNTFYNTKTVKNMHFSS